MNIWVDADACPNVIKDILYKAANRTQIKMTLVANQFLNIPKSNFISFTKVDKGIDVADSYIVENVNPNDLVITADIPLASEVVKKNALALNPRGKIYTKNNIGEVLATRNLMDELRSTQMISGGPATLNKQDRQNFANSLDKVLTSYMSRMK